MRHPHGLRAAFRGSGGLYIGTVRFLQPQTYNTYTWVVPFKAKYLFAKVWGSAGAPDGFVNSFPGGDGGSGGYAQATIPVTGGETLRIGVGRTVNNGGASKTFGGSGGGFSSIFRGTTPLIIGGGGGGGQVNGTHAGGAGGGASGQASTDGQGGGTQSAGGSPNGSFLQGGSEGGGGGYYGGGGASWSDASGGGSGFINASGNIHRSYTTGNRRTPPNTSDPDYPSGTSFGGLAYAVGGLGNNSGINTYGSGAVIIHLLGDMYDPAVAPVIPTPRIILGTF
jgi:hypothetical protein